MRVLTVFAHLRSGSFCHAVQEGSTPACATPGTRNDIVDLQVIGFDPVLRDRGDPNWMGADAPDHVLERMHLREAPRMLVDEFALRYPGITRVDRELFCAVHDGDTATLQRYLGRAYVLSPEFQVRLSCG